MSLPEPVTMGLGEEATADLVEAGVYATASDGFEHGLVVLAAGAPYWLVPGPEGHRLLVEAAVAARVRVQLARFDRESAHWPPKPLVFANPHATDLITPLLWAAVVLVVHYQQQTRPQWAEAGALDAAGIFDRGEWWRVGTALWLHADGGHAVSNALMGVLLFTAVLKTLGAVPGWLWVAAAGLGGNLVVAAVNYPGPYRSLGASTAIFGGLGLLTGHMVKLLAGSGHPHRGRAIFVARGAGVVVLALYGAGGARVDLGAHLAGFLVGLVGGYVATAADGGERGTRIRI
jgi:membrane associated rhomboid family serine protease